MRIGAVMLAAIVGGLAIAGCGSVRGHHGGGASAEPPGRLVVWQRTLLGGGAPTGAALTELQLRRTDGLLALAGSFRAPGPAGPLVSRNVPPGRYTLQAAQRLCDPNCAHLDPPTRPCIGRLHIATSSITTAGLALEGLRCQLQTSAPRQSMTLGVHRHIRTVKAIIVPLPSVCAGCPSVRPRSPSRSP